jgi:hypothetical protein
VPKRVHWGGDVPVLFFGMVLAELHIQLHHDGSWGDHDFDCIQKAI